MPIRTGHARKFPMKGIENSSRIMTSALRGILVAIAVLVAISGAATAEKRVALVMGNGAYAHLPRLQNPSNDAHAIAEILRTSLDFEVVESIDADLTLMMRRLSEFGNAATDADIALVFYAGHGIQANGRNYLLPVSAEVRTEIDLRTNAVRLDDIAEVLDVSGAKTKLIFLDACRDNPLPRLLTRGAAPLGLARQETASIGTFFAFATAPNQIAYDGTGSNSPFTEGLLTNLAEPGLEIRQMMTRVRNHVFSETNRQQIPWVNEALLGEVFLAGARRPESPAPRPSGSGFDETDLAICERLEEKPSRIMLESYLERYPDGFCAPVVRGMLKPDGSDGTSAGMGGEIDAGDIDTGEAPPADLNYRVSSFWNHNGSKVALSASGNSRVFYYEEPRPGMKAVGVRRGTLLFKGRIEGMRYIGEAYVFSSQCGPMAYPVEGEVSQDWRTVVMRGRTPRRSQDCSSVTWRDDELTFSYLSNPQ